MTVVRGLTFYLGLLVLALSLSGCANFGRKLKSFLNGAPEPGQEVQAEKPTSFSENPNVYTGPRRQYRRITKSALEDEAQLEGPAGSLWVMEGQGAYLFSQNIIRMVGDPIGIRIDGEPREQLKTKVDVIRRLLEKLENRAIRMRTPASEKESPEKAEADEGTAKKQTTAAAASARGNPASANESEFNVHSVPTRITERLIDGNYRIKGSQPFMIGSREYKVIVTGIVRAADFNEEGISATQLLDPKFDIVSVRRKESTL